MPTPETSAVGVNAEKEPELEGLNGKTEEVDPLDQEYSEKEVKTEVTQSEPAVVVPEVMVVVETPSPASAELSQTSVEGEGESYVVIETASGEGVNEVRKINSVMYIAE